MKNEVHRTVKQILTDAHDNKLFILRDTLVGDQTKITTGTHGDSFYIPDEELHNFIDMLKDMATEHI